MPQRNKLFINTDTNLSWDLFDDETGAEVDDATVTAQVYTAADVAVGSPVSCTYQAAGRYLGIFPATALTEGANYYVLFTATQGGITVKQAKPLYKAAYDDGT